MLLLQGVFRSGTTALFQTLRRDDRLDCFYEPLHPDLLEHAREADSKRPDHPKSSLYEEYRSLLDRLDTHLDAESLSWPPYLGKNYEAPALAAYLHFLTGTKNSPLLQFNRVFWMAPWLAQAFPNSGFVHLVRDPRSVVWSQLTTASGTRVRMDWPLVGRLLPFTSGTLRRAFSEHAYFGAYQLDEYFEDGLQLLDSDRTDPLTKTALRRLATVDEAPPYVKALALWGAQVEACHRRAQSAFGERALLLRYEDFCDTPCESLRSIYALQDRTMPNPVRDYARTSIDATRLWRWGEVKTAEQRFREGIRRAQIADLMRELGYDPS